MTLNRRVKQVDSKGTSYSFYSKAGKLLYREKPSGGVNYIYLNDKLIAKDGAGNANGAALPSPKGSLSCSPSACSASKTRTGGASITVTLSSSCNSGCDVEWFYTEHSVFNNSTGTNPKTFSYYCRNITETHAGSVGVIITDKSTGMTKSVTHYLTLSCKTSGGGGIEP